jgi:hypothetical protein
MAPSDAGKVYVPCGCTLFHLVARISIQTPATGFGLTNQ